MRASIWYRYDGGWINRVDPDTGATINHNVNYSNSIVGRLAAVWQPAGNLTVITPSFLYQRQDKNDDSTYWPAYSDPSQGHFNTATPERLGGPDEYYLPAIKVEFNLKDSQIIANASYYHRKQITAYQGTVYDLSYWQTIPGGHGDAGGRLRAAAEVHDARGCHQLFVVPAARCQRHPPAGGPARHADPQHHDQHPGQLRRRAALAVNRHQLEVVVHGGRVLAAGQGKQRRGTQVDQHRPRLQLPVRAVADGLLRRHLLLVPRQRRLPVHPGLRYLLQQQHHFRPADCRLRGGELRLYGLVQAHRRRAHRAHRVLAEPLLRRLRELRSGASAGEPEGNAQYAEDHCRIPGDSVGPVLRQLRQGLPCRRRQCAAAVLLRR